MAINVYLGIMGSGKTYEVVTVVIYNAILSGRRVVTNISGINIDAILDYAQRHLKNLPKNIGEIVPISHEEVLSPEFWRTDQDAKEGVNSFIQGGDLIVLDEVWRFWNGFDRQDLSEPPIKRPERVRNFIRMHRQFTNELGHTCDLALITQDVNDLSRFIRGVVDQCYVFTKLLTVGLSNKYRCDVYTKARITRKPLRQFFNTYDKDKFCFYKSHSQSKDGQKITEHVIDKRANILKSKLIGLAVIFILLMPIPTWVLWKFFHPSGNEKIEPEQNLSKNKEVELPLVDPSIKQIAINHEWYVVGYFIKNNTYTFQLRDRNGNIRLVKGFANFTINGTDIHLISDQGAINNYSAKSNNNNRELIK